MSKNNPKGQHFVPACYLREWIDFLPPLGRIWVFSKDGRKKRKQRPEKVFVSNDLYTIEVEGKKSYKIEETLSNLEGRYATIFREKIKKHIPINDEEHAILCAFVSTMLQRTLKQKENIERVYDQLIEHTESLERAHNLGSEESEKLRNIKKEVHKLGIVKLLPEITEILLKMNIAFLCVGFGSKFITSDNPCNLFNPDLQWQKFYGPGLAQKNVEVTLPLSPHIMLCMSWSNLRGYIKIKKQQVDEANRKIIGSCHQNFISSSRRKKWVWFQRYPMDLFFILKILRHKTKMIIYKLKTRIKSR